MCTITFLTSIILWYKIIVVTLHVKHLLDSNIKIFGYMDYKSIIDEDSSLSVANEAAYTGYKRTNALGSSSCIGKNAQRLAKEITECNPAASEQSVVNLNRFLSICNNDTLLISAYVSVRQNSTILVDFNDKYFFAGVNIGDKGFSFSVIDKITNRDYSGEYTIDDYVGVLSFFNIIATIDNYGRRAS